MRPTIEQIRRGGAEARIGDLYMMLHRQYRGRIYHIHDLYFCGYFHDRNHRPKGEPVDVFVARRLGFRSVLHYHVAIGKAHADQLPPDAPLPQPEMITGSDGVRRGWLQLAPVPQRHGLWQSLCVIHNHERQPPQPWAYWRQRRLRPARRARSLRKESRR